MADDTKQQKLFDLCSRFVEENQITCCETIGQCDWVMENAADFIEEICETIGYVEQR